MRARSRVTTDYRIRWMGVDEGLGKELTREQGQVIAYWKNFSFMVEVLQGSRRVGARDDPKALILGTLEFVYIRLLQIGREEWRPIIDYRRSQRFVCHPQVLLRMAPIRSRKRFQDFQS